MSKLEVIDARNNDHMLADGAKLKALIVNRIGTYQDQYQAILKRMLTELPSREEAVSLMVALQVNDNSLNERALMFKAFIDRAVWLDNEIRALTVWGSTFSSGQVYRITVDQAARLGVT